MRRSLNKALWLFVHKIPWKPLLIWGPWVVLVLVAAFYFVENWRGQRAWDQAQQDLRAARVSLDLQSYVPERPPGAIDPTTLPGLDGTRTKSLKLLIYQRHAGLNHTSTGREAARRDHNRWQAQPRDIVQWLDPAKGISDPQEAATELDKILTSEFGTTLAKLRSHDPSQPLVFSLEDPERELLGQMNQYLKYFSSLHGLGEVLSDDTALALAHNDAERAFANLRWQISIINSAHFPTLLSVLYQFSCIQFLEISLWEAVISQQLDLDQLEVLNAELSKISLPNNFANSLKGELAFFLAHPESEQIIVPYMPGWNDLGKASVFFQTHDLAETVATEPLHHLRSYQYPRSKARFPGDFFAPSYNSPFLKAATKLMKAEVLLRLARLGIALEIHRHKQGHYPATLAELDFPTLLDPYTGKPFHYQRKADGSPWLWSIGPDGKDDGGTPAKMDQGDLVWMTTPIAGLTEKEWKRRTWRRSH
ncbi:hypothetical protein [Roseibacillus ishigakijimensis]|nr:hypothetical protein [Roseibacillus ishigakijimensis]